MREPKGRNRWILWLYKVAGKTFYSCNWSLFKWQCTAQQLGCKGLSKVFERAEFINRRYTKGVPFLRKRVNKRVRGWTLGPSLPVQNFVEFPPPPGIFLDPILWVSGGSVWPVLMIWCTIAKTKTTRNQTKPKPKNISHDLSSAGFYYSATHARKTPFVRSSTLKSGKLYQPRLTQRASRVMPDLLQGRFDMKRATSLFDSFCSNVVRHVVCFCWPFSRNFRLPRTPILHFQNLGGCVEDMIC